MNTDVDTLTMEATGKWHVETSHGTYYLIDFDSREYTRSPGEGRNSLGRHDVDRFDIISCAVGEPMHLENFAGRWVHSTPITLIKKVSEHAEA